MTEVLLLDAQTLQALAHAALETYPPVNGVTPAEAYSYLDTLIDGSESIVTNSKAIAEATSDLSFPADALINDWLNQRIASSQIKNHILTPQEAAAYDIPDGGERSLIELTSNNSLYVGPGDSSRIVTGDARMVNKPWWPATGWGLDNINDPIDLQMERIARSGGDTLAEARVREMLNSARLAGETLHNGAIRGIGRATDLIDRVMADTSGVIKIPGYADFGWLDLAPETRAHIMNAAGEAVGAAAILIDAYATRQALWDAMLREDWATADEILGGLIGRSFGGAYFAVVGGGLGFLWGGPPGAIGGAIAGGFWGGAFGGDFGAWLFGGLGDAGWHPSEALADLANWLRDFQSDPIVLDLGGDGFDLTALASSTTYFDLDEDGLAERTGWVGAQDGLLVRDINGNGASTSNEIMMLAQANIVSLGLSYAENDGEIAGNTVARIGGFTRSDGATRAMASVWFALDQSAAATAIPAGADVGDLIWLPRLGGAANDNESGDFPFVRIAC